MKRRSVVIIGALALAAVVLTALPATGFFAGSEASPACNCTQGDQCTCGDNCQCGDACACGAVCPCGTDCGCSAGGPCSSGCKCG